MISLRLTDQVVTWPTEVEWRHIRSGCNSSLQQEKIVRKALKVSVSLHIFIKSNNFKLLNSDTKKLIKIYHESCLFEDQMKIVSLSFLHNIVAMLEEIMKLFKQYIVVFLFFFHYILLLDTVFSDKFFHTFIDGTYLLHETRRCPY